MIGSGPAGLAAARAFRKRDAESRVIMITGDRHPPYARPPLTKDFLRGDSALADLWLTESGWFDQHAVELRTGTTVRRLDCGSQRVILDDGADILYTQVVLATGSRPTPLPVPGGDDPALIYVRDLTSGHRLRALTERPGQAVAVIGSGFIGCETAASLAMSGVPVTLISDEHLPHATRLGEPAGREILAWLTSAGVETRLRMPLSRVDRRADGLELELSDGRTVLVSAAVVGGGARPNASIAEDAGLLVEDGAVRVDTTMRSADPDVFAVGDIAYADHLVAGRPLRVEHWGDAEQHGNIAGVAAAGGSAAWDQPPGFWSTIGDRTLKYTAWGDGHDGWTAVGDAERWSIWYRQGPALCGVLTHNDDDAYWRCVINQDGLPV